MKKVYGVGINDSDYSISQIINGKQVLCEYYTKWRGMLQRCYDEKFQVKQPTYIGCSVDKRWHSFINFKTWMQEQDWEGKHLDKDLLIEGNKVYSPETCLFISRHVNNFTISLDNLIEDQIGIEKRKSGYKVVIGGNKNREYVGTYSTQIEAQEAWYNRKYEITIELADKQSDPRVKNAILARLEKGRINVN